MSRPRHERHEVGCDSPVPSTYALNMLFAGTDMSTELPTLTAASQAHSGGCLEILSVLRSNSVSFPVRMQLSVT